MIYVVMPILNGIEFTARALASFRKHTKLDYKVILIDNNSTDGSEILKNIPDVHYIKNEENLGFVKAVNIGIEYALKHGAENIIIANNDIIVSNMWLDKMLSSMKDGVGVTSLMTSDGGKNQSIFTIIDRKLVDPKKTNEINASLEERFPQLEVDEPNSIIFCLAMINRKVFEKIGLLSEDYGLGYGDDGDFNIRARKAGFKLVIRKDGFFYHYRRSTFSQLFKPEEILEMQKNNIKILESKYPEHFNIQKQKLNILLTNNHLVGLGGSETFTYSMAKELVSLGHNVDVFTFNRGMVSEEIGKFCNIIDEPKPIYDLILINHNSCLERIKDVKGFKIFTAHGIYPALEQPVDGANAYVAISEEVQKHLKNKGYESELLYNGVDCDRFYPKTPINRELKRVFSLCQGRFAQDVLRQACKILGIELIETKSGQREWNVEDYINEADLVVSLGRGAYESMACGRAVIVYDARPYGINNVGDGIIKQDNIDEILKSNCSGRSKKIAYNVALMVEELKKYSHEMGEFNRLFALNNFNIKKQVDKYLNIYATRK